MLEKRLIPVLLIQNRKLVKSIKFKKHNYLGDPINAVKIFSTKTVNELIIVDIEASRKSKIDMDYLYMIADECFIPLTYCGGVDNLKQMEEIYKIGFEKIAIDSALFSNRDLLENAIKEFGSSSIVVSITIKKDLFGRYKIYDYVRNSFRKQSFFEFLNYVQTMDPGEIFLNNASYDGLMVGYDRAFVKSIAPNIQVPFTVCGGAGEIKDAYDILSLNEVTGAAAGSIFVYSSRNKGIMINYPNSSGTSIFS